jgi:hypothetical protein
MLHPEEAFLAYAERRARMFAGGEWLVGVGYCGSGQSCYAGVDAGVGILAYKVNTLVFPQMPSFSLLVVILT